MELIEKILNLYLSFADVVNAQLLKFSVIFIFVFTIWISFIGIVTPILLISTLAFGYYGIIVSLLSVIFGSIISFFLATKTKYMLKKLRNKKPFFTNDPFIIYIILRLIPGIPFLVKNFSIIFFKLNLKSFFFAVLISDTPQILIFTFFFKRLIDSSSNFLVNQEYNRIFELMYMPLLILIIFIIFIFFLKKRIGNQIFNKDNLSK
jgi:uncharacterized membrane protein YdjX (TVP38/TMEM64 family)